VKLPSILRWGVVTASPIPPSPQVGKALKTTNQCHVTLRAFSALDL